MAGTSLSYLKAEKWDKLEIDFKKLYIAENNMDNPTSLADWLRYHRALKDISRRELELTLNLPANVTKAIEDKGCYPNKEVSKKLAQFFELSTEYFYDTLYEENINLTAKLKEYRHANNLTIKAAAKKLGVSDRAWSGWENNKYSISRENYYKLKELKII